MIKLDLIGSYLKDLIFSIKTLWQALRQSNNKWLVLKYLWKFCDIDARRRLIDKNTKYFHASMFFYLSLLICSHIVIITAMECVLFHSVIFFLFYVPLYRTLLPSISAVINFNVKEISKKICYCYTAFDTPCMYKTAEAKKNFF